MKSTLSAVIAAGLAACAQASAPGPTETDPDKYTLLLENESVRVLEYRDRPGDRTKPHHHDDFVLYALAPFKRKLTFPDGTSRERTFRAGEVIWMTDQKHVGENTGDTDTHVLIVELKR